MGLRFRRSIGFGPFRFNIGKSGLTSVSTGFKGARLTTGRRGTNATLGIPGTGLSYTQRVTAPSAATPPSSGGGLFSHLGQIAKRVIIIAGILLGLGIIAASLLA